MFANTYHLMLQPGIEAIENAGGLHAFMNRVAAHHRQRRLPDFPLPRRARRMAPRWSRRVSEAQGRKGLIERVTERGVTFKSYRDGRTMELTPESSAPLRERCYVTSSSPLDELPPTP